MQTIVPQPLAQDFQALCLVPPVSDTIHIVLSLLATTLQLAAWLRGHVAGKRAPELGTYKAVCFLS